MGIILEFITKDNAIPLSGILETDWKLLKIALRERIVTFFYLLINLQYQPITKQNQREHGNTKEP